MPPQAQTTCVEISPLHCAILRKKGHTKAIQTDFLEWKPQKKFCAGAMNPPFSEGRWQAHLRHTSTLVADGGRIGAVLPLTAKGQAAELLPGFEIDFSQPIHNAFEDTSISVVILNAVKPGAVRKLVPPAPAQPVTMDLFAA